MYYAFELYPSLPPRRINGFERPRGRVHCFAEAAKRTEFLRTHKHSFCISAREARELSPVDNKHFTQYARAFKE